MFSMYLFQRHYTRTETHKIRNWLQCFFYILADIWEYSSKHQAIISTTIFMYLFIGMDTSVQLAICCGLKSKIRLTLKETTAMKWNDTNMQMMFEINMWWTIRKRHFHSWIINTKFSSLHRNSKTDTQFQCSFFIHSFGCACFFRHVYHFQEYNFDSESDSDSTPSTFIH